MSHFSQDFDDFWFERVNEIMRQRGTARVSGARLPVRFIRRQADVLVAR